MVCFAVKVWSMKVQEALSEHARKTEELSLKVVQDRLLNILQAAWLLLAILLRILLWQAPGGIASECGRAVLAVAAGMLCTEGIRWLQFRSLGCKDAGLRLRGFRVCATTSWCISPQTRIRTLLLPDAGIIFLNILLFLPAMTRGVAFWLLVWNGVMILSHVRVCSRLRRLSGEQWTFEHDDQIDVYTERKTAGVYRPGKKPESGH